MRPASPWNIRHSQALGISNWTPSEAMIVRDKLCTVLKPQSRGQQQPAKACSRGPNHQGHPGGMRGGALVLAAESAADAVGGPRASAPRGDASTDGLPAPREGTRTAERHACRAPGLRCGPGCPLVTDGRTEAPPGGCPPPSSFSPDLHVTAQPPQTHRVLGTLGPHLQATEHSCIDLLLKSRPENAALGGPRKCRKALTSHTPREVCRHDRYFSC